MLTAASGGGGSLPGLTLKAWAITDGTTLYKQFNCASVSNGSGNVTLTFSTALTSSNPIVRAHPQGRLGGYPPADQRQLDVIARSTTSVQYSLYDNTNTKYLMLHYVEIYE